MRVLIAALVALAGCYAPNAESCQYRCGPRDSCPDGFTCHDGFCGARGACITEDAPVDTIDDAAIDTPIDAMPCTGTTMCWLANGTPAQAACNDGPALGTCVPDDWRYCGCGTGGDSVFVETISGNSRRVIVVHQAGLLHVALAVVGICHGTTGTPCDLDTGACAGSMRGVDVWTVPIAPGSRTLTIYSGDVGAPCSTNDGGMVLMQITVAL